MIQIQKLALEELHAFLQNPSYTPWVLKMSHAGLDEPNEEKWKKESNKKIERGKQVVTVIMKIPYR